MENVTLQVAVQVLNAAALAVFAWLLAKGILVPMPIVEKYMLAPRDERIAALERVSARREEQYLELQKMTAGALEAQGRAIEVLNHVANSKGGDSR